MTTLNVQLPDSIATQARDLAERAHVSVDHLIATALAAQIDSASLRPTIAERARRVDWEKVDAILARVPAAEPQPGDEKD
jgi:hypothetical protein